MTFLKVWHSSFTCPISNLCSGSSLSIAIIIYLSSLEYLSVMAGNWPLVIRWKRSYKFRFSFSSCLKGLRKAQISYAMQPRLHTSLFQSYPWPFSTSGDMYSGVPTRENASNVCEES